MSHLVSTCLGQAESRAAPRLGDGQPERRSARKPVVRLRSADEGQS